MLSAKRTASKSSGSRNGGKQEFLPTQMPLKVAALYFFATVNDPLAVQPQLLQMCRQEHVRGTLLLAREGINGTIAGPELGVGKVVEHIKSWDGFSGLEVKYSVSNGDGFHHMRVKVKPEIVTMGKPDINPNLVVGTYVDPEDWNSLLRRDDVLLVDTRNEYEIHIGKFKGAVNPHTETFKEFPEWADKLVQTGDVVSSNTEVIQPSACTRVPKALAMYCTGGIRCEKATAYMKQLGVQEVYHLKGGILKYLEVVPESESLWEGECFVFDERVSLKHNLQPGSYTRCYACKMPLSAADCAPWEVRYQEGVHCTYCVDSQTPEQARRFRERQLQVTLARERGEQHVGQQISYIMHSDAYVGKPGGAAVDATGCPKLGKEARDETA